MISIYAELVGRYQDRKRQMQYAYTTNYKKKLSVFGGPLLPALLLFFRIDTFGTLFTGSCSEESVQCYGVGQYISTARSEHHRYK